MITDRQTFSKLKPVIFFLTSRPGEVLINFTCTDGYKTSSSSIACTVRGEPPIGGGFGPTKSSVFIWFEFFDRTCNCELPRVSPLLNWVRAVHEFFDVCVPISVEIFRSIGRVFEIEFILLFPHIWHTVMI